MFNKLTLSAYRGYLNLQRKVKELQEKEDGMETLETVILVAVAVIVAILIVNVLTKDGFEKEGGGKCGLVEWIFGQFKNKMDDIFDADSVHK